MRLLNQIFLCFCLLCSASAQAVLRAPDGRGQVLIYPYFSAHERGGQNSATQSLFSVFNDTADRKAIKVRFREALNGRVVFSVNVYLGQYDVWTAAVFVNQTGAKPVLMTLDGSCTVPAINGNPELPQFFPGGPRYAEFSTLDYTGT